MEQVLLFRNHAVTTRYAEFFPVLRLYERHERRRRRDICLVLRLSGGQADRIFHDMKTLGLIDDKYRITPLGRRWEREIAEQGLPTPGTIREAALNVPLFDMTLRALPDVRDSEHILAFFQEHTDAGAHVSRLGSARWRYLEAFYGITAPAERRRKPPTTPPQAPTPASSAPPSAPLPRSAQLVARYVQLINDFGADDVSACHAFLLQVKER